MNGHVTKLLLGWMSAWHQLSFQKVFRCHWLYVKLQHI